MQYLRDMSGRVLAVYNSRYHLHHMCCGSVPKAASRECQEQWRNATAFSDMPAKKIFFGRSFVVKGVHKPLNDVGLCGVASGGMPVSFHSFSFF